MKKEMSLEYWKREKNFIGVIDKGYAREPEGFPYMFLLGRLLDEAKEELYKAIISCDRLEIVKECADVSNLCDFISNKAIMNYPDLYDPKFVDG